MNVAAPLRVSASALLLTAVLASRAHAHSDAAATGMGMGMGMDMDGDGDMDTGMGEAGHEQSASQYPPTYFAHPGHVGVIYAHIALMVLAWVFVLPIGMYSPA